MIDGNISMEEDTELRDLVVQTLENNGVFAKLRAELRASVFLALEEQEAVANPEPLLNKTVKQYLADEDGKFLFSLVREFLEYFGLGYTISVYDSETYLGKEYDYPGRNKLSDKLGLVTDEPLLGEILKNGVNAPMDDTRKSRVKELDGADRTNVCDATFQVSKFVEEKDELGSSSNDNDSSDKPESISEASPDLPINVTITDKKKRSIEKTGPSLVEDKGNSEIGENERVANNNVDSSKFTSSRKKETLTTSSTPVNEETTNVINESERSMVFDEEANENEDVSSERRSVDLRITNNAQNKLDSENNFEKTVYLEEMMVDGKRQRAASAAAVAATTVRKSESLLGELPPLLPKSNSIFGDLPPLNGKKTNINDLKELMDIGLGVDGSDNYEEDFVSSASGSANEQSPIKDTDVDSPDQSIGVSSKRKTRKKRETSYRSPTRNDDMSEEVDEIEEVFSNVSCLEDASGDNGISNFPRAITADCNDVS